MKIGCHGASILPDRTTPTTHGQGPRAGTCEGVGDMTVLMIATWLMLQIPAGMLVGRWLQHAPVLVPIRARR